MKKNIHKNKRGFTPTPKQRKLPGLVCEPKNCGKPARSAGSYSFSNERGNLKRQSFVWCRGFTIVELLVSIGLFSVIVSIAMGGFVRALRTQRQVVALINANSNVSLVVEQLAREIRTGYNFPQVSGDSLSFTDAKGNSITYSYHGMAQGGIITRKVNSGVELQITPDNVNIRYLNFTLLNNSQYPPRITINIGLSPSAASAPVVSENVTNIQTTISARSFSIPL